MRVFLAINIPDDLKIKIEEGVKDLKKEMREDIKWVENTNWHLTLKFFGEIDDAKLTKIKESIKQIGEEWPKFVLYFKGIGAFPDLRYPRVIFINIDKDKGNLIKMHCDIEREFKEFSIDNKFSPHLTLARSRRNTNIKRNAMDLEKINLRDFFNFNMEVNNIALMKSTLFTKGPVYEEIFSLILK
jgi:RNA 2',3'-cyclic 3'-phosphodiesterase